MRTALVLGSGDTLHDDLAKYDGGFDAVFACNDAGAEWPGILAGWVTLHPVFFEAKGWLARRAERGYPPALNLFAHQSAREPVPDSIKRTSYLFPGQKNTGSSGLFAAKVALVDCGFDKVVLCGIPMTATPHFFDAEPWTACEGFRAQWRSIPDAYKRRMRSMSGWTRELLGDPHAHDQK